jgi:hypothetical protein
MLSASLRFGCRLAALLLILGATAADCGHEPPELRLGVANRDGQMVAVYEPCPGERVDRVQLLKVVGSLGGGDDLSVWEIRRSSRSGTSRRFVFGEAPSGWRVVVPYPSTLEYPVTLQVTDEGGVSSQKILTGPVSAPPGQVWGGGELMPLDEFVALAEESCLPRG